MTKPNRNVLSTLNPISRENDLIDAPKETNITLPYFFTQDTESIRCLTTVQIPHILTSE
jgi:hypothetical protein